MSCHQMILGLPLLGLLFGCSVEHDAKSLITPPTASAPPRPGWVDFGGDYTLRDGGRLSYWGIRHKTPAAGQPAEARATTAPATTASDSTGRTALLLHPLLTNKTWFAPLGRKLAAAGWDVILLDLPGHGGSSGGSLHLTWGAKEKFQIRELMDHVLATEKLPDRIYVLGASMGACVAIQYAAVEPRCRGVVSIAAPASFRAVARLMFFLRDQKTLDERIARAGELAGFNPDDASAVDAAAKLTCPLIVVHGKLDMVVPFSQGEEISSAARGPKKLIPLDFANHASEIGREDWLVERMGELDGMRK